jgi:hypothetical protein
VIGESAQDCFRRQHEVVHRSDTEALAEKSSPDATAMQSRISFRSLIGTSVQQAFFPGGQFGSSGPPPLMQDIYSEMAFPDT